MHGTTPFPPSPGEHIGTRLRDLREAAGLTREELADRTPFTADYIKLIELGRRSCSTLSTIIALQRALRVRDITLLTGSLSWTLNRNNPADRILRPATDQIADLIRVPRTLTPATEPQSLDELQASVDHVWRIWHTSPNVYSETAGVLPRLLADVEAAASAVPAYSPQDAETRRRVSAIRAQAWHLARQWLREIQAYELAALAAERSLAASQVADSPLLVASSAWNIVGVHLAAGYFEEAEATAGAAVRALAGLSEDVQDERLLGMSGALLLYSAIAQSRQGDRDSAERSLQAADDVSRQVGPEFFDDWTTFGVVNIEFYRVGVEVELGNGQRAADLAGRSQVGRMPCAQRRARYLIDVARAHADRGEDDASLSVFLQAERESHEQVNYSLYAREAALGLLHRWRVSDREALHAFASRLALTA